MLIDQINNLDQITKSLNTDTTKGISNFLSTEDNAGLTFGTSYEKYEKKGLAGVGASGSVNMQDATYQKPGAEESDLLEGIDTEGDLSAEDHKNRMVVLSQTTSPADYKAMEEEGFSLENASDSTIITVSDKIKTVMAKAGVEYGSDLSEEELEAITGSVTMATSIQNLNDGAKAYLIKNEMEPTIENVYTAGFSGANMLQVPVAEGDFEALKGQVSGILEDAGMEASKENLANARWLMSYRLPVNQENLTYLADLQGLEETIETSGITEEMAQEAGLEAISAGRPPKEGMLLEGYSIEDRAQATIDFLGQVTDDALAYCIDQDMDLTVENLRVAMREVGRRAGSDITGATTASDTTGSIEENAAEGNAKLATARRQLEEVRLSMTLEANQSLLKRGIQIDTEPIEQLVEELRGVEDSYYRNLLSAEGIEPTQERVSLFRDTTEAIEDLKMAPAYILGQSEARDSLSDWAALGARAREALLSGSDAFSVEDVSLGESGLDTVGLANRSPEESGQEENSQILANRARFQKAEASYETLWTAPRRDMGDSISKAFRNVDDILEDMKLDPTESNRRAVRILAYNETQITEENITEIKARDEEMQRAFKNLTPSVTLQMIREGINPLEMSMSELNETAMEIKAASGIEDHDRFSQYLYKLDSQKAISQEERESYIGIYRLMSMVEQNDGAAIGALMQEGADLNMKNLLSAVRSAKKGKMDYKVDDDFAGVEGHYSTKAIDTQILAAYQTHCMRDVMDTVSPQKLDHIGQENWEQMTPEELKEALAEMAESEEEAAAEQAYIQDALKEYATVVDAPEDIYEYLSHYDIPTSAANLEAAMQVMANPNRMFRDLMDLDKRHANTQESIELVQGLEDEIFERFAEAVKTPEEMAQAQEDLADLAENAMKGFLMDDDTVSALDLKELRLLTNQFSLCAKQAKQESYIVPVQTGEGTCGVSVKVMRGTDEKGYVDIMLRGQLMGKLAASFEAKEDGTVSGVIAVSDEGTRDLVSENLQLAAGYLNESLEDESIDLRVALIKDLSLEHFELSSLHRELGGNRENEVQTKRLYGIAEGFLKTVSDLFGDAF